MNAWGTVLLLLSAGDWLIAILITFDDNFSFNPDNPSYSCLHVILDSITHLVLISPDPHPPPHHSRRKVSQDLSCGSGGHRDQERTVNYEILNLMMIQTGNNYLTREGSSHLHTVFLGITI